MYTRKDAARAALLSLAIVLAGMIWHPWKGWAWQRATASTYGIGDGFLGGPLACGGRLDDTSPVVAHKTLPCGTRVAFRYGRNAAVGVVRDRGPYVAGRTWDLGPALERELGFSCGVCSLSWRIAPSRPRDVAGYVTSVVDAAHYRVQVGTGNIGVRALAISIPAGCGGAHATRIARLLLVGRQVALRVDTAAPRAGRYVLIHGRTFQSRLVRAGLAKVAEPAPGLAISPRWHRMQTRAAQARRATWGDCPVAIRQAYDFTHDWRTQ